MEKVGKDEEKTLEEEASNSVEEETMSDKDDERIRGASVERFDPVDHREEGFTDQSNSQTVVTFEDHDVNEYEMEDEKVLELFRRNNSFRPEVSERNNNSEGMVLQFQEDTPGETVAVFHSPEILEGTKSSSASNDEDTEDSSDLDSNLSRYYFDGSLPVSSAHVEESETDHDEYHHVHEDETKMPLLYPKRSVLQPTSWRNCCGLLELLRAADP